MAETILSCGACLRKAMRLLPQHRAAFQRAARLQSLLLRPTPMQPRFASTLPGTPSPTAAKAAILGRQDTEHSSDLAISTEKANTVALDMLPSLALDMPPSLRKKRSPKQLERDVRRNLEWLQDPWKIGNYVEEILKNHRYEEALVMVQVASVNRRVEVAWNHLIKYHLKQKQWRAALKTYSDVSSHLPVQAAATP